MYSSCIEEMELYSIDFSITFDYVSSRTRNGSYYCFFFTYKRI